MGYLDIAMRESVWLCLLTLCALTVSAGIEVNLARLLQYNKEGQSHGSQLASLNFVAAYFEGDVLRKIAFVHFNDIKENTMLDVLHKKPNGLIIILPPSITDAYSWRSLQEFLYDESFPIPIYFVFEDDSIMNIYQTLKAKEAEIKTSPDKSMFTRIMNTILAEDLQVSVNIDEPKSLHPLNLESYYYVLPSSHEAREEKKPSKPIIVLTATYDSFSLSPDLSFGVNTNGSGMIAILELIRIFQKLFEAYGNYAKYDLMFLLTPTGSLNYKGTDAFLNDLAESYGQNIAFALCLDSIGIGQELYLHISRPPKTSEQTSAEIFNAFNMTAKQMGVSYNVVRKPINQTSEHVPWEHERFAYKKIHGATISARGTASNHILDKTSIYDTKLDEKAFKRNIEAIGEALTKVMYGLLDQNNAIFTGDYEGLASGQLAQLTKFLQQNSRFPTKLAKGSEIMKEIGKVFHKSMPDVTKHAFQYKDVEFFTNAPSKMKVIKTKSRLTDMFLFVLIAIYLVGLYAYMTGFGAFVREIKGAFGNKERTD